MIVIPPQDPNERRSDPIAEALVPLYEQFTDVLNLGEFHAALRSVTRYINSSTRKWATTPRITRICIPKTSSASSTAAPTRTTRSSSPKLRIASGSS